MGVGYSAPINQYRKFVGIPVTETGGREAMAWGTEHEPTALKRFFEICPQFDGIKPGLLLHEDEHACLGASLDNLIWDRNSQELINLEVKCTYYKQEAPQASHELQTRHIVQIQVFFLN
jgi:hypothetical protein